MLRKVVRSTGALLILVTTLLTSVSVSSQSGLDPAMVALWERTDRPVADQQVDRSRL